MYSFIFRFSKLDNTFDGIKYVIFENAKLVILPSTNN